MLKGIFAASGITFICLAIPLVHFVSGPIGPFFGGFIGGSIARAQPFQALVLGISSGLLTATPAVLLVPISHLFPDLIPPQMQQLIIWAILGIVVYTGLLSSLGALWGGHRVRHG